jgi:transposase IS4-like protein/transposase IS116/IS110/IS902 family protein
MGEGVAVRPDQVSLGVLVSAVPRDAVDEAVAVCGVREKRSDARLPAHVITYLTLALCLFPDDDYTEVATKVTGSLDRWGCWNAGWSVPTASAITQARKRLGRAVFPELFERACGPVAGPAGPTAEAAALGTARGSFLRRWRLLAIDGFEVDLPDSTENAAEFGYAGSGANRSAFPKARVVALAECGTHAFVAAEVDAYAVGEKTLAARLLPRLRADELLTADRGFYSWPAWDTAAATGAGLLWRAPTQLELPVVTVLSDGTYLTALIKPSIRRCWPSRACTSRPGVGPTWAGVFVAEIGDVTRSASARHLCSSAGLTPRHRESDTTDRRSDWARGRLGVWFPAARCGRGWWPSRPRPRHGHAVGPRTVRKRQWGRADAEIGRASASRASPHP